MAKDLLVLSYRITKKVFLICLISIIFSIWLWPLKISFAQQNVNVSAFVDSKASATKSTIEASSSELTADGKTFCTITVTVADKDDNPLENIKVVLKSNRGIIDTITASSNYEGNGIEANENYSAESHTNNLGKAYFKIKSDLAGKATFSALVDNAVTLSETVDVTFQKPLTPAPITVTVTSPPMFGIPERTITLFKSPVQQEHDKNALVEQGVELRIPFAVFVIGSILVILQPILLIIIIAQAVAYRRRYNKIEG